MRSHADRADQPRPRPHLHEHRHADLRPTRGGLVGLVRPRLRGGRPARLRRPDLARAGAARCSRSPRASGTAASCPAASRACTSAPRATPCSTFATPRGTTHAQQREVIDAVHALTEAQPDWVDDPEVQARAQPVRDGLPDADERARAHGPRERARSTCWTLYGVEARRRHLRRELPAGPAAGRARRALHPALPPRLGPPQPHQGRHRDEGARGGPGDGRADQGPRSSAACSTTRS